MNIVMKKHHFNKKRHNCPRCRADIFCDHLLKRLNIHKNSDRVFNNELFLSQ